MKLFLFQQLLSFLLLATIPFFAEAVAPDNKTTTTTPTPTDDPDDSEESWQKTQSYYDSLVAVAAICGAMIVIMTGLVLSKLYYEGNDGGKNRKKQFYMKTESGINADYNAYDDSTNHIAKQHQEEKNAKQAENI
jgi:hypothetical protein